MAPEPLFNTGGLTVRLPFPSLPQTSTNAMAQNDHLPLVFKFGEVDSEPEEIENKEEWGLMDMAQNELAAAVAAPAPVPAPIPAPAPATIPVALTGWSPSTIAELEAAGVSEVSADPRELVYMPAPAPVPVPVRAPPPTVPPAPVRLAASAAPVRAPPPTAAPVPVRLAAPAAPVPVPVRAPPSAAWDAVVDRYLSAAPVAVLPRPARRSRDDMMFDLQVKNILCCLEDFNNGIPEDDNDNDGAARRLRRRRK